MYKETGGSAFSGIGPKGKAIEMSIPPGSPCVICKGSKNLCGKERCPLMVKSDSRSRTVKLMDTLDLAGMSPPSVFVGRFGSRRSILAPWSPL